MTQKYDMKTMQDFLELSQEQRKRCVVDMLVWAEYLDEFEDVSLIKVMPSFVWVDDDRTGEISGIQIDILKEDQ